MPNFSIIKILSKLIKEKIILNVEVEYSLTGLNLAFPIINCVWVFSRWKFNSFKSKRKLVLITNIDKSKRIYKIISQQKDCL
jgi:hypothetical protein